MPEFVLHRDFTLATTKGHRIAFTKDVPVHVPDVVVPDVVAIGAVPANGKPVDVVKEEVRPVTQDDPGRRASDVQSAIEMLVESNNRSDFAASGAPTIAAIAKITGYEISRKERDEAWQKYHDLKAAA